MKPKSVSLGQLQTTGAT